MSIRPLPQELQEKAENELNEVPGRVQEDLKCIRDWLTKQPHLNARHEDHWLLNFLRNSKFSLQRTKKKLDDFYMLRTLAPDIFGNRDPFLPEIQEILKRGVFSVVIDTSKQLLPVTIVVGWKRADPVKVSMLNLVKALLMILDILLEESDEIVINGMNLIEDFEGMSLGYLPQITPAMMKKFVLALQDVYPIRIKGAHMINAPSYFETIYNLVKPFLKEKIKKRLNIYGSDFNGMYQHISISAIPKEYGGTGDSVDNITSEWKRKVESYRDWFLNDIQYRTDETKRPGKPKTAADVFAVDGSFRKLDID